MISPEDVAPSSPDEETGDSPNDVVHIWDRAGKMIAKIHHGGGIYSASFNSDGTYLVTASADRKAKIWRASDNSITDLQHEDEVNYAAFDSTGTRVVTASDDRTARIWTIAGSRLATIRNPDAVRYAEFSRDGKRVVTAAGKAALVWTTAGKRIAELPHPDVVRATFSRDGNLVLTASGDRAVNLWRSSGKHLGALSGHQDDVNYAIFSPDGSRVVTASEDQTARIWDTGTLRTVATLRHEGSVSFASFSNDGRQILTVGEDSTVRLWSENGLKIAVLQFRATPEAAAFEGDQAAVITVAGNEFRTWQIGEGQFIPLFHPSALISARFHPNENRVLTIARDGIARLWTPATKTFVPIGDRNVRTASFSEDGQRIRLGLFLGVPQFWSLEGKLLWALPRGSRIAGVSTAGRHVLVFDERSVSLWSDEGVRRAEIPGGAVPAAVSGDGMRLVTAMANGTVSLWDGSGKSIAQWSPPQTDAAHSADSGKPASPAMARLNAGSQREAAFRGSGKVRTLRFSPDSKRLLIVYDDGVVQLRTSDGAPITEFQVGAEGLSAELNRDGSRILITDESGNVHLWGAGQSLVSLPHKAPLTLARFDPNGSRILTAEDKAISLWNVDGQHMLTLQHDSPVQRVDFNSAGDRILTASANGSIRVWKSDGRQLAEVTLEGRISSLAFNADATQLVATSGDTLARIFNLHSPDEIRAIAANLGVEPLTEDEREHFLISQAATETPAPAGAGRK